MNVENDDNQNHKEKSSEAHANHRMRMRFEWTDLVEELIQDGRESGAFDDLRGMGKPLKLDQNPYALEWDLAHQLMKDNDVLPPWIAKRNGILRRKEEIRADIRTVWLKYAQAYRVAQGKGNKDALSTGWDELCQQWEKALQAINRQIEDYNLARPSDDMEMVKLQLDMELVRAGAKRWLTSSHESSG